MTVPIQEHVDPGGMLYDIRIVQIRRSSVHPHMSEHVYQICSFGTDFVQRGLHRAIELFSCIVLHKPVYVFTVAVLEEGRSGGRNGTRCCDAHETDLHTRDFLYNVRLEHQSVLVGEIAADIRKLRFLSQFKETFRAVIELMVAGNRDVVPHPVHQFDDSLALCQSSDRLALYGVAVIYQDRGIPFRLQRIADLCDSGIPEALIDSAVDIAGIDDIYLPVPADLFLSILFMPVLFFSAFRCAAGTQRQYQAHYDHEKKQFLVFHFYSGVYY